MNRSVVVRNWQILMPPCPPLLFIQKTSYFAYPFKAAFMFGPAWPSGHSAQLSLGSGDVPATSRRRQLGLAYPHVAVASMQSLAYPHGAIARWQDWAGLHVAILPVAETIYFAV